MMKSVRLFNANTLFKVSLIMIVMVAAIYVIGFLVGSAAGKSDRENTDDYAAVAEENGDIAYSALNTVCCVIGFAGALLIYGNAINLYYKVDGSKYARTIKHGGEMFGKSLAGSVIISSVTAVAVSLVLGIFTLAGGELEFADLPPMVLFSLGASLLSGILIRPLVSTKTANARSILLLITLLVAMFILSATATAASHISYSATLTASIILTVVGAVGAAVSTVSACRYIKENWQF